MSDSQTIDTERARDARTAEPLDSGFGAEFRELARQRRFVRELAQPAGAPATAAPVVTPRVRSTAAASAGADVRMTHDAAAMFTELSRMSDRLVEAREVLASERARADHAQAELVASNERLMAARVLVHDAQRATRSASERCAWLEGRCHTLEEALDVAVHASLITRWKWRRQARRAPGLD